MDKVFRFTGSFNLAVYSKTLKKARLYVKQQAMSSVLHRTLKYSGEGHPPNPENWVAASAK
jgi:hypothetical protein